MHINVTFTYLEDSSEMIPVIKINRQGDWYEVKTKSFEYGYMSVVQLTVKRLAES
jgi:hypothetical protein